MSSHTRTQTRTPGPPSSTAPATNGSQTILQTEPRPAGPSTPNATLRLRGASPQREASQRVQWAEDVVDNEHLGKKSSKVCCIYHKPHEPGDSSSDSDSSSGSDGDSDGAADLSRAQRPGGGKGKGKQGRGRKDGEEGKGDRKPSPNAYERVPKHSHRHEHKGKKEG